MVTFPPPLLATVITLAREDDFVNLIVTVPVATTYHISLVTFVDSETSYTCGSWKSLRNSYQGLVISPFWSSSFTLDGGICDIIDKSPVVLG